MSSHGSARLKNAAEMARYVSGEGMYCGVTPPPGFFDALRAVRRANDAPGACRMFLHSLSRTPLVVSVPGVVHAAFFIPSGGGKSTGIVVPKLLSDPNSAVVIDPKGELYGLTARARAALGNEVAVIDPFGVTGTPNEFCFNPLSLIGPKSPRVIDDAGALANALIVRPESIDDPHFLNSAELYIKAVISAVIACLPGARNLPAVASTLADKKDLDDARTVMKESNAFGGGLRMLGNKISAAPEKEEGSIRSTISHSLSFLDSPLVAESLSRTTFDPEQLINGRMTIYLCLPPEFMSSHAGLMRVWIAALILLVTRSGLKNNTINFLLDEAASLGKLESLENALVQLRGYGVRFTLFYQSLGQLKKVFGEGQDQTFLSNMSLTAYAAVNDYATAEQISKMLGKTTIANRTGSAGWNKTHNYDPGGRDSSSEGSNLGVSVTGHGRELLTPDEVMTLPPQTLIVFTQGSPAMLVDMVPYYDRRFRLPSKINVLPRCVAFCVLSVALALLIAGALFARWDIKLPKEKQGAPPAKQAAPFKSPGVDYFIRQNQAEVERLRKERK